MKAKYYFLVLIVLMQVSVRAQMKIGNNPTNLNSASLLELESTNKGFVFPRVSLTNVTSSSPLPGTLLTGTVVFNTNASVTNGNGVGLYVWTGSAWQSLAMNLSTSAWQLTGNSGTSYSTNFLGTTDNISLRFRTNNTERMVIDSIGSVGIGSTSYNPNLREKFLVDYGTTTSNNIATFKGSIDDYFQVGIQNLSSGTSASSDFVATSNDGTDSTYYIDMGINGSNYAPSIENWGGPHDGYLYTYGRNLIMGVQGTSADVIFLLGGGKIKTNAVLRLNGADGNIIVGTGENSNLPVGNVVRGPNANSSFSNIAGGDITFQGGSSTGTTTGGSVNIKGGSSSGGTYGSVNINASTSSATNINTGTSGSNITVGGTANNILFPKFSTVGGLYYTSVNTGQISTTGSNMTWDSINNRLGIGITSPGYKLSVLSASNPLYLSGVQATSSFSSDSVLTILNGVVKKAPYSSLPGGSGWALTGNSGTSTSTNFVGTTDGNGLVFKVNNTQAGYLGLSGSSYATSFGVGASGTSTGFKATAIGASASATANTSVALGFSATASSQDAIAIGDAAQATSSNEAIAIGHSSTATAFQSIALGVSANASTSNQTIAIGVNSAASGYQGIAIGYGSSATSNNSAMAVGVSATASGYQSTAIGNSASATAQNSTAIGNGASTNQTNALVLGNSNTNVGIGTSTPNTGTKLDVDGSFKLGSSGSVLSNIIKTSVTVNPASVTTAGTTTVTATVTGASSNATVIVNPRSTLSAGLAIAYAYVSSSNTITIAFITNTAVDPPSMTLDVTVIQ